ncbi:MAG: hypothetical protein CMP12_20950 [Zunongwangia sp.]|uniref:Secreted protein n=3 Tax=Zunongwangia profunda TaxID=398743 RepID=D5BBW2_ZUNPS|nr:DUF6520 family protein [Zunongwangia profunda]ADF52561.1 secreted protein [Zunongwangia profunda SM-A87]MAO38328.1 hypothetical protein [Zunongwangia sp.]HCV82917.1 hypothetical protein [Zunongwangia profunda]|tara:strand:+ start:1266 stop:1550 length:285 start_codon:yes stop_codon:yes gene_type:complete
MKKLKVILPLLAIIFAIGVAFATVGDNSKTELQANDYVQLNGTWQAIPEQSCENGEFTCQVQLGQNGPVLDVYDERGDNQPKASASDMPTVIIP